MYCDKCGSNNVEGAVFCEKCGKRLETEYNMSNNVPNPPMPPPDTGGAPTGGTVAPFIIGVIIVALVGWGIWALISHFACNGGYKAPINQLVEAVEEKDVNALLDGMPEEVRKIIKKSSNGKDSLKSLLEELEDELDGDKLKYKVTKKKRIDKDDLDDTEDEINEYISSLATNVGVDSKKVKIDAAYELEVEFKWGKNDSELDLTVFKVDGKWYSLYEDFATMLD